MERFVLPRIHLAHKRIPVAMSIKRTYELISVKMDIISTMIVMDTIGAGEISHLLMKEQVKLIGHQVLPQTAKDMVILVLDGISGILLLMPD